MIGEGKHAGAVSSEFVALTQDLLVPGMTPVKEAQGHSAAFKKGLTGKRVDIYRSREQMS